MRHALVLLLCVAACGPRDGLFPDAVAPRLGDKTKVVEAIPDGRIVMEWFTHWNNPEWLLVYSANLDASEQSYLLYDAGSSSRELLCTVYMGAPLVSAWREDIAYWDLLDGELYLWGLDGHVHHCADGTTDMKSTAPATLGRGTASFAEGGVMGILEDGTGVGWLDYRSGVIEPVQGLGEREGLVDVLKRPSDAAALWVSTHDPETNHVRLYEIEAGTRDLNLIHEADLGDNTFAGVTHSHPDAFLFEAGSFTWAMSRSTGDAMQPVGATGLDWSLDNVVVYPDGTGFVVWGTGISVDLQTGYTHDAGIAAYGGWHYVMEGDWSAKLVTVYANNSQGSPDTPFNSFTLDLSAESDWLGPDDSENRNYAKGFANGACVVGRSYVGLAIWYDGRPWPEEEDDLAWNTQEDVFYAGRCGDVPSEFSREVSMSAATGVHGFAKHDQPLIEASMGLYRPDGDGNGGEYGEYQRASSAWALSGSGYPTGVWEVQHSVLIPRTGSRVWTHDSVSIRSVDMAPFAE